MELLVHFDFKKKENKNNLLLIFSLCFLILTYDGHLS